MEKIEQIRYDSLQDSDPGYYLARRALAPSSAKRTAQAAQQ